jgi:putative membrane protein
MRPGGAGRVYLDAGSKAQCHCAILRAAAGNFTSGGNRRLAGPILFKRTILPGGLNMKHSVSVVLTALFLLGAHEAHATSNAHESAEQTFVTKAAQAGLVEVELGKLAQMRSADPGVKSFAAQMVKDHEKVNAELRALAEAKKLNVPNQLDRESARIMHRMSARPPSEFDGAFGSQMVEAHEAAITLFSDAAALRDKDLVAFAEKMLPTLLHHRQLAEELPKSKPARRDAVPEVDPLAPAPPDASPREEDP